MVPESNESLLYTGNERVSPFCEVAEPVPRGHVPSHEGDFGGKIFFDALKQEINSSDIEISCDSRVKGLVINDDNEIVGVAFKKDNVNIISATSKISITEKIIDDKDNLISKDERITLLCNRSNY